MRPGCRAGWLLCAVVGAAAVWAGGACGGASVGPASPLAGQVPQRIAPAHWEHLDEARAWPPVGAPFTARGHGTGEQLIDVRVSPSSLAAYRSLTPGLSLPTGTILAAFHRNRVTGEAGSVYAMTKHPSGTWEYVVAAPDGVIEARGTVPLCARCHAEAPADSAFGVRAPAAHPAESSPAGRRSP